MHAIQVVGLVKRYAGAARRPALAGVDLVVPRGVAFGLIGPNGAGKTTLLKALLGVIRPTAGSVRVFGAIRTTCRCAAGWAISRSA